MKKTRILLLTTVIFSLSSCGVQQALLNQYEQIDLIENRIAQNKELSNHQLMQINQINSFYSSEYIKVSKSDRNLQSLINEAWMFEINKVIDNESLPENYIVNKHFDKSYIMKIASK